MYDATQQAIYDRLQAGIPTEVIAKELFPNENLLRSLNLINSFRDNLTPSKIEKPLLASKIDYARQKLQNEIGAFNSIKVPTPSNSSDRTILVFGDAHIPWHDEKALAKILSLKADEVVINGDILDCYSASRFTKEYTNVLLKEEIAQGRVYLEALAERFPVIKLIEGNHDARYRKVIQQFLPYLVDVLPYSITEILSKDMPNVTPVSNTIKGTSSSIPDTESRSDHWYCVGDAVIGHWEFFSQIQGRAAEKAFSWISKWKEFFQFEKDPKVLIQGHTHRFSRTELPGMTTLYEGGCVCKPQAYQLRANGYGVPPQVGYILLNQRDGVTISSAYERLA